MPRHRTHTKKVYDSATTDPNQGDVTDTHVSVVLCSTVLYHLISVDRTGHTLQGHPRSCVASGARSPISRSVHLLRCSGTLTSMRGKFVLCRKQNTSSMLVKFFSSFETSSSSSQCLSTNCLDLSTWFPTRLRRSSARHVTEQST